MAFFGHLGNVYHGAGSMPYTTFNTVLDDIVADVNAAVLAGNANGWSVWDDQRNLQNGPTTMVVGYAWNGGYVNVTNQGWAFTNASTTVTGTVGATFGRATWEFAPSFFQIQLSNNNQANWSANIASVTNDGSLVLSSPWGATTASYQTAWERVLGASGGATYGYVVLKCTSQNGMQDYFVRILRPPTFGSLVRVDAWETWDNVAHSGTNPGPQEIMYAYSGQVDMATSVGYAMWLLPDAFAMGTTGNFCYIGNLDPLRGSVSDPTALVCAFSDQSLSGYGVYAARATIGNLTQPSAGATILRSIGGTPWASLSQQYQNTVALVPRGMDAVMLATPATSDHDLRFLLIGVDAYAGVQSSFGADTTGKRGGVRYLKYPVMNPTSRHQTLVGPCDDGNTYLCWIGPRPRAPVGVTQNGQLYDVMSQGLSGFAHWPYSACCSGNLASGEVIYGAVTQMMLNHRYYALPVNL